jgi:hypothetical protein
MVSPHQHKCQKRAEKCIQCTPTKTGNRTRLREKSDHRDSVFRESSPENNLTVKRSNREILRQEKRAKCNCTSIESKQGGLIF